MTKSSTYTYIDNPTAQQVSEITGYDTVTAARLLQSLAADSAVIPIAYDCGPHCCGIALYQIDGPKGSIQFDA